MRQWSMRSASGVKEKCAGGQGKVRQGLRRSASGVKEKCAGGQGKVRQGSRKSASDVKEKVLQLNTTHSAKAILLDPRCASP